MHERIVQIYTLIKRTRNHGGRLSSDAGLVLLTDPDEQLGYTRAFAAVLKDLRDPRRVNVALHNLLK